jgi:hypothetical protein
MFGSLSWSFLHAIVSFELSQTSPTHSHAWLCILSELGVIQSAFVWVITSSGGIDLLRFSCYSWCLPTPRRLGAAEECWQELVIVLVHLPVIVRGSCAFLGRAPKATLVDCAWLVWSPSCVGCAAPDCGLGLWCLLAYEPLSGWIATIGTGLPTSRWNSREKSLCHLVSEEFIWYSLWLIDCHLPRWYNPPTSLALLF